MSVEKKYIIIPSRYNSSRFPGKSLAKIHSVTLLNRVWINAMKVKGIDEVFVATDDIRIKQHAESFGAKVIMTSENCANGTERIYEAINELKEQPDCIINLQGDAPLLPHYIIQKLADSYEGSDSFFISTLACKLTKNQYEKIQNLVSRKQLGGTQVVFDNDMNALYFSKALIPCTKKFSETTSIYKHIGIYAYSYQSLKKYVELKESPLEKAEGLEQLRALENGMPIKIVPVDYLGRSDWSVDLPEDISIVENIISREGELI